MKKKLTALIAAFGFVVLLGAPAYAAGTTTTQSSGSGGTCGDTKTQLISCDPNDKTGLGTINGLIKIAVTVLTVLIGVVAVGGLAYAAIIYASARDQQDKVNEARVIIRNILIGIGLYAFTVVIINWLIPGGVIGVDASPTASPSQSVSPSTTTGTSPGTVTPGTQ